MTTRIASVRALPRRIVHAVAAYGHRAWSRIARLWRRTDGPDDDLAGLTKDAIERIRALPKCTFCGGFHDGLCRRVVVIEYWPDTREQGLAGIKMARFRERWDESRTTYPEQLDEWEARLKELGRW